MCSELNANYNPDWVAQVYRYTYKQNLIGEEESDLDEQI